MDDVFLFILAILIVAGGVWATFASARTMLAMADELEAGRQSREHLSTMIATEGTLRVELYRFFTEVIFTGIGIVTIIATLTDELPTWARLVTRLGIFAAVVLVYLQSLKAARTRREAIAQLRIERGEEQEGG